MKKILELKPNYLLLVKVVLIIVMVLSFYNGAGLGVAVPQQFDVWSDEVIISDIIHDSVQENSLILQVPENETLGLMNITNNLVTGNTNDLEFFDYLSNMGLQAQVFRVIYEILPFSGAINLQFLYMINAIFMTISTLLFLMCIKEFIGERAVSMLFILILFCSPTFLKYGRNLYWLGYMIFLPFLTSLLLCKYKFGKKHFHWYAFLAAFLSCLLKMMCSYEFISAIMVSAMIPYILYSIVNELNVRETFKQVIFPAVGCLFSFPVALGIHAFIVRLECGKSVYWSYFSSVLKDRIYGNTSAENPLMAESATVTAVEVVSKYFQMRCFTIFGLEIKYLDIIMILFLSYIVVKGNKREFINKKIDALFLVTVVSFLAPLSWFILAKPHAYIHTEQCAMLWYLPSMLLVGAFLCGLLFCRSNNTD